MQPQETPGGGETSLEAPRDTRKPRRVAQELKTRILLSCFVDFDELGPWEAAIGVSVSRNVVENELAVGLGKHFNCIPFTVFSEGIAS